MRSTGTPPPRAPQRPHVFSLHGDTREDPYYWLNGYWLQNGDSDAVLAYLRAENAYFEAQMAPVGGLQKVLYQEMLGRIRQDDASVPYFKNGYWYITRFREGEEYPVYLRRKGAIDAPDELLLDVNELARPHAYCSVSGLAVSPDNTLLAYGIDTESRRRYTLRFKNLVTGETLAAALPGTAGHGCWAADSHTFFYITKDSVTLRDDTVLRYNLRQDRPEPVFREADPAYTVGVSKTKSGAFIILTSSATRSTECRYLRADDPVGAFTIFQPREDDHRYAIADYRGDWYITTNWQARNFRLMRAAAGATAKEDWTEVIPHRSDVLLGGIEIFREYLVLSERHAANTQLRVLPWDATVPGHTVAFDEPAYTVFPGYNPEFDTDRLRYGYTSLTTPASTCEYDMATQQHTLLKQQAVQGGYDPAGYTTERLWATAEDGTRIPLSLVYKNGFRRGGGAPLLLYGYGSYGISVDPHFSSATLSLLDRGWVYCIAHVRGGEELGRDWYEGGKMFHKKNSFTDFIACAEYLLAQGYAADGHLYAQGGSAGGLLVGTAANLRPDLWRGIIAQVPFVDVVTTMLDERIPLTTGEFDEWGNPNEAASYFYMKSYAPYDNVREGPYPALLVPTGLHDSQVQYFEPAKWVARLRERKTNDTLLLLHTDLDAGHGGASGRFRRLRDAARNQAFLLLLEGQK